MVLESTKDRCPMAVCIIGLGYVGLPMAVAFSKKIPVIGVDIDETKVKSINTGNNYLVEARYLNEDLKNVTKAGKLSAITTLEANLRNQVDAYIISVPTPIDNKKRPVLDPIIHVGKKLSKILKKGDLVILESTTFPGTTREVLKPILEESGLIAGKDFHLAYSPERIDPGSKWKIEDIPKVVGGYTKECGEKAAELYRLIIKKIVLVRDEKTAEAVKMLENAFRAINIAYVNEFARYCHLEGIDAKEVIQAASTKPYGYMPFWPSLGVGGHCIPVDPWYLIERGRIFEYYFDLISLAMRINDEMPHFTLNLLRDALDEEGIPLKSAKIIILGISYKRDTADPRESPSLKFFELLKGKQAKVSYYDPYIPSISFKGRIITSENNLDEAIEGANALVLGTDHSYFRELDFETIGKKMATRIFLDGKNMFERDDLEKHGFKYVGVGRGGK